MSTLDDPPTTLSLRTPDDVLAAASVVLGFVPEASLVMMTFGSPRSFHARVDLPETQEQLDDLVASLLEPALRHGISHVVLVAFEQPGRAETGRWARRTLRRLATDLRRSGIDVAEALRADGSRWWSGWGRTPVAHGVPYDVDDHPFVVRAVFEGRVVHRSRAELAAAIAPDERAAAVVAEALGRLADEPPLGAADVRDVVALLVTRHAVDAALPGPDEVARLLLALDDVTVRDAVLLDLRRETAAAHVELLTHLVRRAPDALLPSPAAVLGFAAWLAGHGALAWCAVERCLAVDPDHRLVTQLATLLDHAVPPHDWEEVGGGLAPSA